MAIFVLATPALSHNIITSHLQERISESKSGEHIRINIRLAEQYDSQLLATKTMGVTDPQQRRKIASETLKSFSKASQQDLLTFLQYQQKNMEVSGIKSHWIINLINAYATAEVIEEIALHPDVVRVDYDQYRQVLDLEAPAAPTARADKLSDGIGDGSDIEWNVSHINAPEVWQQGFTGEDIIVAVLDTGVNAHQDLSGRMWEHPDYPNHGYNFADNNYDTFDGSGHGTHCAGTVAGNGTAGTITGVAPEAIIMDLKVLDSSGGGTESGVWAAIEFAVDYGAHVMSLSLGWQHQWGPDRAAWRTAMENAMSAGVIASVAAGNEGDWGGQPAPNNIRTPGDCPAPWSHPDQISEGGNSAVVTVGSTTQTDNISGFSSIGPVTWQNVAPFNDYAYNPGTGLIIPDVVAPGSNINSLDNESEDGYTVKSGTSMAAPAVAGLMALMLSKNPFLTPEEMSQILEESAVSLSETKSNTYGSGRIDALEAINATSFSGLIYQSHILDDSQGNDDGYINPGELINIAITMHNPTEEDITDATLIVSSDSDYISFTDSIVHLGDFEAGEYKFFNNVATFETSEVIPGNHEITFSLVSFSTHDDDDIWESSFVETAHAPYLSIEELSIDDSQYGNDNGILDPGETANIIIKLKNTGQLESDNGTIEYSTESEWLTLLSDEPIELPLLAPQGSIELIIPATTSLETPLESAESLFITAQSGLYTFEDYQNVIIGEVPVFSDGPIPTTFNSSPNSSSHATQPGQLTVNIPKDATITGVDVEYKMTSTSAAWMSEQRSFIRCVSEGGTTEPQVYQGSNNSGGTYTYERTNLDIANNVTGGGDIEFELHAFRTWGGSGTNTQYAYVPNNSWRLTLHYELPDIDITFKVSNQINETVEGAVVKVSEGEQNTNEQGETTFTIIPGGYFYSVMADKHVPIENQHIHINQDTIVEVLMERLFYASFNISDPDGSTIDEALLKVEGEVIEGHQLIDLRNGIFEYTIEAEGYAPFENQFEINDADLVIDVEMNPFYKVHFAVFDQWSTPVENATFTIEESTYEEGVFSFEQMLAGTYNYTVYADYYQEYHDTFTIIDDDLQLEIYLDADGTDVIQADPDENIRIYPNPAKDQVNIELDRMDNNSYQVTLLNQLGQAIKSIDSGSSQNAIKLELNVSKLNAGIYFLRIENQHMNYSHKLIVR